MAAPRAAPPPERCAGGRTLRRPADSAGRVPPILARRRERGF